MVTAEHVATAMRLSDQDWSRVEIPEGRTNDRLPSALCVWRARIPKGSPCSNCAQRFLSAQSLQIRIEPLAPEERVVSLAYPSSRLRFAGGRFVEYGDSDKLAGTALLEMYDGDDRLVLDHGASGAPVLDCEGRVVAVVSNLFTQTMQFPSRAIRISTAWGTPTSLPCPFKF